MKSVQKYKDQLQNSEKIAIITHTFPDADAIASVIAMKKLIQLFYTQEGTDKQIDIYFDFQKDEQGNYIIPNLYQPMLNNIYFNQIDINEQIPDYDLAICTDCPNSSRSGIFNTIFNKAKDTLNLDHHDTNDYFANNNLVIKNSSSTCEIIYRIETSQKHVLSDDICRLIYAGVITDTNNLTTPLYRHTYEFLSDMTQRKPELNLEKINCFFFGNDNISKKQLLYKALASLKFERDGSVAFMKLLKQDLVGTEPTDTLGLVNHGLTTKGVKMAVISIKNDDNSYYISLRSKNGINVGEIAKAIGGGGHEDCAANNHYTGGLSELKSILLKEYDKQAALLPNENIDDNLFYDNSSNENEA